MDGHDRNIMRRRAKLYGAEPVNIKTPREPVTPANSEPRQELSALLEQCRLTEGGRNPIVRHEGRLYGSR